MWRAAVSSAKTASAFSACRYLTKCTLSCASLTTTRSRLVCRPCTPVGKPRTSHLRSSRLRPRSYRRSVVPTPTSTRPWKAASESGGASTGVLCTSCRRKRPGGAGGAGCASPAPAAAGAGTGAGAVAGAATTRYVCTLHARARRGCSVRPCAQPTRAAAASAVRARAAREERARPPQRRRREQRAKTTASRPTSRPPPRLLGL